MDALRTPPGRARAVRRPRHRDATASRASRSRRRTDSPAMQAARWAFAQSWGTDAGGHRRRRLDPVHRRPARGLPGRRRSWSPASRTPTAARTAPNESVHLGELEKVVLAEALLLERLARQLRPDAVSRPWPPRRCRRRPLACGHVRRHAPRRRRRSGDAAAARHRRRRRCSVDDVRRRRPRRRRRGRGTGPRTTPARDVLGPTADRWRTSARGRRTRGVPAEHPGRRSRSAGRGSSERRYVMVDDGDDGVPAALVEQRRTRRGPRGSCCAPTSIICRYTPLFTWR